MSDIVYAHPYSNIYHKVVFVEVSRDEEFPTFACRWTRVHDMMKSADLLVMKNGDVPKSRLCRRCFP